MIKAETRGTPATILVLGFTRAELEMLAAGRAVHAHSDSHRLTVIVTGGETTDDVEREVRGSLGDLPFEVVRLEPPSSN